MLDQIALLMCNTYSGVHLDICTACAHWTIFNTTCNMVSALLCILHIMQHATCFLMLCSAAIALHGCLCSATDHTDVCTPVSGADGVLRPSLLGRQRHCQCLNLHRNTSPQCHQTALPAWETMTLPMSQSLSQCSSSMSSDCPSTDITMTRCDGAIHVQ